MKTHLLLLLLITVHFGNAQNITLANMNQANLKLGKQAINYGTTSNLTLVNSTITTEGTVTFSNASITFENCTIKAAKVIFQTSVNTINIVGKVKFECKDVEFPNLPAPAQANINLTVQDYCELSILYSNLFNNFRPVTCTSNDNYNFNILKK